MHQEEENWPIQPSEYVDVKRLEIYLTFQWENYTGIVERSRNEKRDFNKNDRDWKSRQKFQSTPRSQEDLNNGSSQVKDAGYKEKL